MLSLKLDRRRIVSAVYRPADVDALEVYGGHELRTGYAERSQGGKTRTRSTHSGACDFTLGSGSRAELIEYSPHPGNRMYPGCGAQTCTHMDRVRPIRWSRCGKLEFRTQVEILNAPRGELAGSGHSR